MKWALLADIHGNKYALQSVLNDLKYREINQIMCLGDLVAIGPHSNEVLHTIMNTPNAFVITGNHDEAVLSLYFDETYPESHIHAKPHHTWVAEQLTYEKAEFLKKQPRQITHTVNGTDVLFSHYAYKHGLEASPISQDPYKRIMEPSPQNMETLFFNYGHDVIAFGHHHPRHDFQLHGKHYINPGALGCNNEGIARYAILSISNNGEPGVEYMEVPYDRTALLQAYDDLAVPQGDELRQIFHGQGRSE